MKGLKRIIASIALLRDERLRGFRVDIEVDSSIYGDAQQEKAERTSFLTAVTGFLSQALQMSAQVPEIAPLMGKFLQFGVRGFRVGRDLETAIEEFCDEAVVIAKKKAKQAASQPNPQHITAQANMIRAQAAAKTADSKIETDKTRLQFDAQESQAQATAAAQESQAEVTRQQIENQGEQANSAADLQMRMLDYKMKMLEVQMQLKDQEIERLKSENEVKVSNIKLETEEARSKAAIDKAENPPIPQNSAL